MRNSEQNHAWFIHIVQKLAKIWIKIYGYPIPDFGYFASRAHICRHNGLQINPEAHKSDQGKQNINKRRQITTQNAKNSKGTVTELQQDKIFLKKMVKIVSKC